METKEASGSGEQCFCWFVFAAPALSAHMLSAIKSAKLL